MRKKGRKEPPPEDAFAKLVANLSDEMPGGRPQRRRTSPPSDPLPQAAARSRPTRARPSRPWSRLDVAARRNSTPARRPEDRPSGGDPRGRHRRRGGAREDAPAGDVPRTRVGQGARVAIGRCHSSGAFCGPFHDIMLRPRGPGARRSHSDKILAEDADLLRRFFPTLGPGACPRESAGSAPTRGSQRHLPRGGRGPPARRFTVIGSRTHTERIQGLPASSGHC